MCKVSGQLKLCSCKIERGENLKQLWLLRRPTSETECWVGEIMPGPKIEKEVTLYNIRTLRRTLNGANCFDIDIQLHENDILELYFRDKQSPPSYHGNLFIYAFSFMKGKWRYNEFNPFYRNLFSIHQGEIIKPFLEDHY